MKKPEVSVRAIPGWVIVLTLFGVLYLTGLHTEVVGQVQRLLLASGLKNAGVPEPVSAAGTETTATNHAAVVGAGFKLTDLNGTTINFASLRGKVVFLNIWATWCPPCVAEMPNIQRLYEKVGSDKIAFVMLSVDKGGPEKVQKFIQKKGYTFPVYLPASQFPQELYSNSIPTTFIISPEGEIVAKQEGMAAYDTPEMREFLKSMVR
ncbi:TlpA family protein disulfide reductase [Pontibacter qinzhouensis]|uniref:TlpA family protein disulfide reductase n=1 Tax=Pontibacter qinzhouensis TaxID=2603253 RepID=A0A5C8K3Y0_9BACT|nr:TlpA family protein disulfide reductase [Pontibacter qinzhouensis]TXK45305.1 TlpA family protein disulfide reductase [Pontibacter qinzhouensis]